MTPSKDADVDVMSSTGSKKLTRHVIRQIAKEISGDLSSGFAEEVLETISAATCI